MKVLYVISLICSVHEPTCSAETARAYHAQRMPPGQIVCGLPATNAALVEGVVRPNESEYIRTRCELRPD